MMNKIKFWITHWRWFLCKLIAGKEPIVVNCCFNGDALKKGWSLYDENNPDKSLITAKDGEK